MNIIEIENQAYIRPICQAAHRHRAWTGRVIVMDVDGNEYLDCSSGHGVANLGHAHPKIAEAISGRHPR